MNITQDHLHGQMFVRRPKNRAYQRELSLKESKPKKTREPGPALQFECETCGAKKGRQCISPNGNRARPHQNRRQKAGIASKKDVSNP